MRGRLATRLAIAFAAVALAAIAVLGGLTLLAARDEVSDLAERQRQDAAVAAATTTGEAYVAAGGWDGVDLRPASAIARAAGAAIVVRDATGARVSGRGAGGGAGGAGLARFDGPALVEPVVVDGTEAGTVTLRFADAGLPAPERQVRDALVRRVVVGSLIALAVALAIAAFVSGRLTRPLRRLGEAVGRMRAGERGVRSEAPGAPGEIRDLAVAFDAMSAELAREDELRRAVISDVAHELRTPLTILQGHCEALVDGVETPSPEGISSMHDEVVRLGRVVEDVEALASAEAAGLSLRRSPVDLAEVVRAAAAALAPRFAAGEVALAVDAQPAVVDGDADRLAQVVTNLLTNALKFTPAGGWAEVSVGPSDGAATLVVADDGPGIPDDELPHVLARFWRGRGAASVGGSGIGLAVVDELVRAHGGVVAVESPEGGGARVTVRIPLA